MNKKLVMKVLDREHAFSDMFVPYLPARNIRNQEEVADRLLFSGEKRLRRLLAYFGKEDTTTLLFPQSVEPLAEITGNNSLTG